MREIYTKREEKYGKGNELAKGKVYMPFYLTGVGNLNGKNCQNDPPWFTLTDGVEDTHNYLNH
jgi:hypothetical protein